MNSIRSNSWMDVFKTKFNAVMLSVMGLGSYAGSSSLPRQTNSNTFDWFEKTVSTATALDAVPLESQYYPLTGFRLTIYSNVSSKMF